jgi:hypothetical protein
VENRAGQSQTLCDQNITTNEFLDIVFNETAKGVIEQLL